MGRGRGSRVGRLVLLTCVLVGALAFPATGALEDGKTSPDARLARLSQSVNVRFWQTHPREAPPAIANLTRATAAGTAGAQAEAAPSGDRRAAPQPFNRDTVGLPQNEESLTACGDRARNVLEGANDFRGLLDPDGNFSGWYLSQDGGASVVKDGLLPPLQLLPGVSAPSGGDPVIDSDSDCNLFYTDLNFANDPDFLTLPNGIGVYKSNPQKLAKCPGGADPSCWPTRRPVAVTANPAGRGVFPSHFFDKPWMDVGVSGDAGEVVWVTFTDFTNTGPGPTDFINQIKAVRCDAQLTHCTDPILLSGDQNSLQFSYVTIGPDGRVYVTWEEDNDFANDFAPPEHMRFWVRVAEPGSTNFGPMHLVANADLNLGIADLHANDFRVSTMPKNTVAMVNGHPRVFLTYEECLARVAGDTACEEPQIKLTWSDDLGATWTTPEVVSAGGDNYFNTLSWNGDPSGGRLAIAYFTNRFDRVFHNRQDVELVTVNPSTGAVQQRRRVTPFSNEPEADPVLGGAFIGDYIQVLAKGPRVWVGYNANYRSIPLAVDDGNSGVPIPQQDNFLFRTQF